MTVQLMSPPPLSVEKLFSSSTSRDSFPFLFYFFFKSSHTHTSLKWPPVTWLDWNTIYLMYIKTTTSKSDCVLLLLFLLLFFHLLRKKKERERKMKKFFCFTFPDLTPGEPLAKERKRINPENSLPPIF